MCTEPPKIKRAQAPAPPPPPPSPETVQTPEIGDNARTEVAALRKQGRTSLRIDPVAAQFGVA